MLQTLPPVTQEVAIFPESLLDQDPRAGLGLCERLHSVKLIIGADLQPVQISIVLGRASRRQESSVKRIQRWRGKQKVLF